MVIDKFIEERVRKILTSKYPKHKNEFPKNVLIDESSKNECNNNKIPYRKVFEKYQDDYRSSEGDEQRINEIAEKIAKECEDILLQS